MLQKQKQGRTVLMLCVLLLSTGLFAQKATLKGTIKDAANGEDLIGATLSIAELPGTGISSNAYGFYSLTLPKGKYTVRVQYLGYSTISEKINLDTDLSRNFELGTADNTLMEVQVKAEREDQNITKTEMSVTKLSPKDVKAVTVLFGEPDILKTIQLLPGVKSAGEGNSGFYVRGGTADQNLILLDEAPVYNASHLLGFFSVFNSDAIKDVTLYKGGMPAEFGGRTASVLDIRMKDGNNKNFGVSGGIGIISSKIAIEGPITKGKGSFIVSGRRTYADVFLKLSKNKSLRESQLYFYDLNLKANYQITEKDRVYLSGYFGRDVFGAGNSFGFDWGNATGTVRWNHLFSDRLFSNTSLIYSQYDYKFNIASDSSSKFSIGSQIQDWNLKQDFSWFSNENNNFKFGFNVIRHNFLPGQIKAPENSSVNALKLDQKYSYEGGAYFQNDWKINSDWSLNYGIRYSFFNYVGAGTAYTFDKEGNILTEKKYKKGESIQYYGGWEPRISAKYQINAQSSIKASLNRNYQYLHLLSNSTTSAPTDIWVPSSNNIKPQIGDQLALGYFRNLNDNQFEFSIEAYYKDMQNLIDYRNGADLLLNSSVEAELVYGKGEAYGAEFFVRKNKGRLTGWVGYTLSRTLRKFDAIDGGKAYSARQDRIHDLSIVAMYDLNSKWKVSANWVFNTGDAVTFPSGRYYFEGTVVPYYTERNGYRFPNYHRLDLGLTREFRKRKNRESSLNISAYNAYGRRNAYSIAFRPKEGNPQQTEAVQTTLFRWIPSITYNFKF